MRLIVPVLTMLAMFSGPCWAEEQLIPGGDLDRAADRVADKIGGKMAGILDPWLPSVKEVAVELRELAWFVKSGLLVLLAIIVVLMINALLLTGVLLFRR